MRVLALQRITGLLHRGRVVAPGLDRPGGGPDPRRARDVRYGPTLLGLGRRLLKLQWRVLHEGRRLASGYSNLLHLFGFGRASSQPLVQVLLLMEHAAQPHDMHASFRQGTVLQPEALHTLRLQAPLEPPRAEKLRQDHHVKQPPCARRRPSGAIEHDRSKGTGARLRRTADPRACAGDLPDGKEMHLNEIPCTFDLPNNALHGLLLGAPLGTCCCSLNVLCALAEALHSPLCILLLAGCLGCHLFLNRLELLPLPLLLGGMHPGRQTVHQEVELRPHQRSLCEPHASLPGSRGVLRSLGHGCPPEQHDKLQKPV
mmetsp:Transcript_16573/g.48497  ORF Transcript_16573/g.48497 Transcript_16573/m.48497 type:complete len:315 (+) Transcript_16573:461-1405(+)